MSTPVAASSTPSPEPPTGLSTVAGRSRVVALVGNPNTGKTSLFNALTGFHRHVANYPGVTVELARGAIRGSSQALELLDLPGTYSLAAVSPDEMVVSNVLSGRVTGSKRPDCILAIVDAANLPRNLYLLSQLFDLGLPIVVALNMVDIAAGRGIAVDAERLSRALGVPVAPVVATRTESVAPLVLALNESVSAAPPVIPAILPAALREEVARLRGQAVGGLTAAEALRVVVDRDGYAEKQYSAEGGDTAALNAARGRLLEAGVELPAGEVRARYAWISGVLEGVIVRPARPLTTWSSRLDAVLTHRVWGGVVLLAMLTLLFQAIFTCAKYPMDWLSALFDTVGSVVGGLLPEGMLNSLLVDGVIGGVGGVLVFLPQILILFALIALLEDSGYLARAAFMMDRVMAAAGLSGRAFIPLLSSFACAVPAIMGARVIADRRERFITILIAPFMSCSARLPVYVLMIGAFVPARHYLGGWLGLQGLVMLAMYLVGVVVAIPLAWMLRKTAFRGGPASSFLLELPGYKVPRWRAIWQRMYFAGRNFLVRAGTVILCVNMIVWALAYFPRSEATAQAVAQRAADEGWDATRAATELDGAYLRDSVLGRLGRAIEPAIRPIGWDWRIGMAVLASFPAREVVVGTLGTIFNLGGGQEAESTDLQETLRRATWPESGQPVFTLPVALSLMVFFALCAQCASTLVMIGRETGSWTWPVASFVGMTAIAYVAALGVAVVARAVGL